MNVMDAAAMHPIVGLFPPSPEQEPAVWARGSDVMVTAGAGAGKTRTLVARYLALLSEGLPLRSVVAITFTLKAAREMRNRVREQVRRYLKTDGIDEADARRWEDIYSALDAARISTIHSLCAEIVRAHPAQAGVDPRFGVLSEGSMALLRRRAVDATMAFAAEDLECSALFSELGERGLAKALDWLLQRRLDVTDAWRRLPRQPLVFWADFLAAWQRTALAALEDSISWQVAAAIVLDSAANDPADLLEIQRQAAAEALEILDIDITERIAGLNALRSIRLNGGKAASWPGGKAQVDEVKAALRALREAWASARILRLKLSELDVKLERTIMLLRTAFERLVDEYQAAKAAEGALDFDDLESLALALLENEPEVAERWQAEVSAILLDEFQDTNARQNALVLALCGATPGKRFLVGDAKQSIYRFRGADVTVLRRERDEIEASDGTTLALSVSYRAHAPLIEALNTLLDPVLGADDDPDRPWVEPFSPLEPWRELPAMPEPHVELHLAPQPKGEGGLELAANALARRIRQLVGQGDEVEVEGTIRSLGYGDFAVLCRAASSFGAYEDAFERAGIPYLTTSGGGFYGRPEIRDLLNTLAAIAEPADTLALIGFLRSPATGFADEEIFRIKVEHEEQRLWDRLNAAAVGDGDLAVRASRAVERLEAMRALSGRAQVADVLKAYLDLTGYRAILLQAGEARASRNVSKLLADAHDSGLVGLTDFLAYVAEIQESRTREGEARATAEGAVQLMSVHAAKGLEFPVVVVGDVTYKGRPHFGMLLDPELGAVLPLKGEDDAQPAVYELARLLEADRDDAETRRLLYVAATRAREKLVLSGCIGALAPGKAPRIDGWLKLFDDTLELSETLAGAPEPAGVLEFALAAGDCPVSCTLYCDETAIPAEDATTAGAPSIPAQPETEVIPPPLLAPVAAPAQEFGTAPDRAPRVWRVVPATRSARAPAWVVGALVHEALADWRFPENPAASRRGDPCGRLVGSGRPVGDIRPVGSDLPDFTSWAHARARAKGIADAGRLADAGRRAAGLLRRLRQHPLFGELDGADRRLAEVPYDLDVDGNHEHGIIDMLCRNGECWSVLEFKTDSIRDDAALLAMLARTDYLAQEKRYEAAVQQLLGVRPRVRLVLLDVAGGIRVLEGGDW